MPQLRVALAQANPVVGDITGNCVQIRDYARRAHEAGAHLVAFPEMMVTGYPVEDLALRANFVDASKAAVEELASTLAAEGLGELVVVVGYLDCVPMQTNSRTATNSAALIHDGKVIARYAKHHLPNYGVFDEFRWFVPGTSMQIVQIHGIDVALVICEDLWQDGPSQACDAAETGLLLVLNGSPYARDKDDSRLELCARRAREGECTVAYVNMTGGQDSLVFEGDSMIVTASGETVARAGQFTEELLIADLELPLATTRMPAEAEQIDGFTIERTVISSDLLPDYDVVSPSAAAPRLDSLGETYAAIVLGLRDYVHKNGFASVLIGISGGIDSTLVAAIACDAIGAENVHGVSNPSDWSSEHSKTDAAELARRTGMHLQTVPIAPMVDSFTSSLEIDGLAVENLQARIRAVIWMALSNQHGHVVLACGNKSELAVGYSTIYGDAVGGYAPLKDVPKTVVWELAKWRNARAEADGETPPIPESTISKPPSAELRPGQLDSDSLPPYDVLDAIIEQYVTENLGFAAIVAHGFDRKMVEDVIAMIDRAEYKRQQYPPGPKVSARNFGRDWRLPMTNRWRAK